ncbi:MAG: bifunctional tRNA (5-methylaminomethyl-2-thiouridine)(34)-methyltransferase MnmD/FAD-dependent 5-carboxymethylaminomethyl-2-thiouridine(34) oxidoreductase MnmC [bacterium]
MSAPTEKSIKFREGVPYSNIYQDIYYATQNGLAESRYVFLQANRLPDNWCDRRTYTIAETGFGTGLNFLATWDLWKRSKNRPEVLHYISVEKHPLPVGQLRRCHQQFPEIYHLSQELTQHYPLPIQGFHRIWLDQRRICLTLCFEDVEVALKQLCANVDCWYLDGFAPAKNPAMWTENMFREVSRISHPGTTLSTFTAARIVRDRVEAAGFRVEKITGYGHKRDMIVARVAQLPQFRDAAPWYCIPYSDYPAKKAVVIGAGIAGAQTAWHLAIRGFQVEVLERREEPGTEGSGNPMAVISPKITAGPSVEEQFSIQCFQYLLGQLRSLGLSDDIWSRCGVLSLANTQEKLKQWQGIADRGLNPALLQCLSAQEATLIAGINIEKKGLYYPSGGWIAPRKLIHALLAHPGITLWRNTAAVRISRQGSWWQIFSDKETLPISAPILVIASGRNLEIDESVSLPVVPVLGQTTRAQATTRSKQLKTVVQHSGYITPANGDFHLLGATYLRNVRQLDHDHRADEDNLRKQKETLSDFSESLGSISSAHTALRITSANRMPFIGPLADERALRQNFHPMLRRNFNNLETPANYVAGLYITAAFGSRGMTNASLGGELLASIICNEPLPLQSKLYHCLHPARHIVRDLKRSKPD